jgi:hypothetical protein
VETLAHRHPTHVSAKRAEAPTASARSQLLSTHSRGRLAAFGAFAAGFIMLAGVVIDLGTMWILQRERSPQWEFAAVTNSVDSIPRAFFALGFLFIAMYLWEATSMTGFRVLGGLLIVLGLSSAALGGLATLSYFELSPLIQQPAVYTAMRSVAIKSIGLATMYAVVAIPVGVLCMRRPKK